ncbi:sulfatase [Jiangella ureilytica]|uniref:Sulfatase n=1 Tax=Jiangella ureilytica TaxID=2530374 RepID=A0A4R4RL27_9ACTN|nr:sulfatase-like hydrolase/transferase [Jiangella ureilytica]TDC50358.1 sulfatase [Jiangella ureilytica]
MDTAARPAAPGQPNIVLVLADDLGVGDLGTYGARLIRTPTIDRLAATGVVCESMYAAGATDTPSRAGLLTGRFGARYGLPASLRPGMTAGLPSGVPTMASLLRSAGYRTAWFGQWRLGSLGEQHPLHHGFDTFAGTLFGTDVDPLTWYQGTTATDPAFDIAFGARRITDEAIRFVDEHRHEPFLIVLSHLAPHAPYAPEPAFAGRSRAGAYGDVVEQLDSHLGRLIDHLHRTRLSANTLVVITSDNGPGGEGRTQSRRGRKPEVYDGGVRVPFVASQLTQTRRIRDTVPRSLLDVTPSLCALAGVPAPDDLDGEDMSALLTGRASPTRGPVYLFFNEFLNAVRHEQWKLHVAFDNDRRPPGNRPWSYVPQLFDVDTDPRETYNLAALHPDVVEVLRDGLEATRQDVAAEAASQSAPERSTHPSPVEVEEVLR